MLESLIFLGNQQLIIKLFKKEKIVNEYRISSN
nr:MAG TPA: hypothetical protein [Caudoviricetes sp.]